MKSSFNPDSIQIDFCEPIKVNFEQPPFWFYRAEEYRIRLEITRSAFPSLESGGIIVLLGVQAIAESANGKDIAQHESLIRVGFKVSDLNDYVETEGNMRVTSIQQDLLLTVTSIAISSARGLLLGLYANTPFSNHLLPVFTPQQIRNLDELDLVKYGVIKVEQKVDTEILAKAQKRLTELKYDVEVTNIMDERTKEAILDFQKSEGLPLGQLNYQTLRALGVGK